jgi:hypothetical protein
MSLDTIYVSYAGNKGSEPGEVMARFFHGDKFYFGNTDNIYIEQDKKERGNKMEYLQEAVKGMEKDVLEAAYKDALQRAKDGRQIGNSEYAEKQEAWARIISNEILKRLVE